MTAALKSYETASPSQIRKLRLEAWARHMRRLEDKALP